MKARISLEHFASQRTLLEDIERKLNSLQTTAKKQLQEITSSAKKFKAEEKPPTSFSDVKKNLYDTEFRHLEQVGTNLPIQDYQHQRLRGLNFRAQIICLQEQMQLIDELSRTNRVLKSQRINLGRF